MYIIYTINIKWIAGPSLTKDGGLLSFRDTLPKLVGDSMLAPMTTNKLADYIQQLAAAAGPLAWNITTQAKQVIKALHSVEGAADFLPGMHNLDRSIEGANFGSQFGQDVKASLAGGIAVIEVPVKPGKDVMAVRIDIMAEIAENELLWPIPVTPSPTNPPSTNP